MNYTRGKGREVCLNHGGEGVGSVDTDVVI